MLSPALKNEINALPFQDKLEVFEAIRSSVMPSSEHDFSELSTQQQQELLLRAERAAAAPDAGHSWEEVKRRLGI